MKIKTNPYSNFNGIFSDKYVIGGEKYSTTMQTYPGEYYLPNAGLSNKITMPDKVVYTNDRYGKTQYKGIVEDKSSDSYLCSDHVNMTDSSGDFSIKLLNKDLLNITTAISGNSYIASSTIIDSSSNEKGALLLSSYINQYESSDRYGWIKPGVKYSQGVMCRFKKKDGTFSNAFQYGLNTAYYSSSSSSNYHNLSIQEFKVLSKSNNSIIYSIDRNFNGYSSTFSDINSIFPYNSPYKINDLKFGKVSFDDEGVVKNEEVFNLSETDFDKTISQTVCCLRSRPTCLDNNNEMIVYKLDEGLNQSFYKAKVEHVDLLSEYSHIGDADFIDTEQVISGISLTDGNFEKCTDGFQNGSKSYRVNNGYSFGYLEVNVKTTAKVIISCNVSSESPDYAFIALSKTSAQPTHSDVSSSKLNSNVFQYLYVASGENPGNKKTVEGILPKGKSYILFGYTKDGSVDNGTDRFTVNSIKITEGNFDAVTIEKCIAVNDIIPVLTNRTLDKYTKELSQTIYNLEWMTINNERYVNVFVDFLEDTSKSGVYTFKYDSGTNTLTYLNSFTGVNAVGYDIYNFMPFEEKFFVGIGAKGYVVAEFMTETNSWRLVKNSPIVINSIVYDDIHKQLCYTSTTDPFRGVYIDPIERGLCGEVGFTDTTLTWKDADIETSVYVSCKNFEGNYMVEDIYLKLEGNCKFKENGLTEITVKSSSEGRITIPVIITGDGVNRIYANLIHVEG